MRDGQFLPLFSVNTKIKKVKHQVQTTHEPPAALVQLLYMLEHLQEFPISPPHPYFLGKEKKTSPIVPYPNSPSPNNWQISLSRA